MAYNLSQESNYYISAECSESLGDAIGLDWVSFSDQPHGFEVAQTNSEFVIGGLFLLISSRMGTIGDISHNQSTPQLLVEELLSLQSTNDYNNGDSANIFWFGSVSDRIDKTIYSENLNSLASYSDSKKTLSISNLSTEPTRGSAVETAGYIVHEASHGFMPDHVDCYLGDGRCDSTPNGAYGLQAWWQNSWLKENHSSIPTPDCRAANDNILNMCESILDTDSYEPCTINESYCD